MKSSIRCLAGWILAGLLLIPAARAQDNPRAELEAIAVIDQKVMMPMRDGVRLATDIYRPKSGGPVPVIFSRTPYNFNSWRDGEENAGTYRAALDAVKRGYAYVVQNERGRFFSEGEWDILGTPLTDGDDAFTWMAGQPWSNGKVGAIGCSSTAEWQMAVASQDHPALAAMVAQGYGAGVGRIGDWYEQGNWYRGGAEQMLFFSWLYGVQNDVARPSFEADVSQEDLIRISRSFDLAPERPEVDWSKAFYHLPVMDLIKSVDGPVGVYEDMIRRKPNDPAWYAGGLYHDDMPFNKPTMWFASWYDVSTGPNIALFNHVRQTAAPEIADNQYLVIAPTLHCGFKRATENTIVGERSMGDARLDYDALTYGWFDLWLKGEDAGQRAAMPRVKYFTMGSNVWNTAEAWPPPEATVATYYLESGGAANSLYGDGRLTTTRPPARGDRPDTFVYDPMNPVPSYGGNVCCTGNAIQGGSFDQRKIEARQDVLVYTTEPFAEGVEVSGSIDLTLYVSSDARDTDFTVKLLDVYPDGKAYNLDETIQRVRYREGYDREVFMEAGEVYPLEVGPLTTSNYFNPGHRIRIEISSSNFPRFMRNLNTGGNNYDEVEGVEARNTVHSSAAYPSHIRLPIIAR
ncbi:MAG: CocE/NonD family hydrolase [Rhodothermales bacterium]|nr:CocE/NonD family hydrolase [Rhodothermales bacterium]